MVLNFSFSTVNRSYLRIKHSNTLKRPYIVSRTYIVARARDCAQVDTGNIGIISAIAGCTMDLSAPAYHPSLHHRIPGKMMA
eukprot:COSAG05_NODE_4267_length_1590_cov_16.591474_1_plen_81_part_10